MKTRKFIAYYRVSTQKQGISGLGLEAQRKAVLGYLDGGRWELVAEETEVESGKRSDRPALAKALRLCRIHNATLIIAKLDRLARNVAFVSNLMESGVEFTAVDFPQANRLTVHLLAAVAEHEAAMISARTKAALEAAKARGTVLGNPNRDIARHTHKGTQASILARQAKANKLAADLAPEIEDIRRQGITSSLGIAQALNKRGYHAPRGGAWRATQVIRLLKTM
jgi:DNA invertase Pin-like site-specific DNA recombinase